jgi:hypothetical protein
MILECGDFVAAFKSADKSAHSKGGVVLRSRLVFSHLIINGFQGALEYCAV